MKTNKSTGAIEINFNAIKHCSGELCGPLKHLFDSSLQSGVFLDLMKIAIVSPVFKTGDTADISNYRAISVLPSFSKILELLTYNRLYKYFTDNKTSHLQQFSFPKGRSREHANVQFVDRVYESFENNNYTVGIFLDLRKAFDTVDHTLEKA